MFGKRLTCICTSLLCCAITMAWTARAAADQAVSDLTLVTEVTEIQFQDEADKKLQYIHETFDPKEIDEAIQLLGTADTDVLFDYFSQASMDNGDPRGPGITNDTCGTATPLTIGGPSITQDNTNATSETIPSGSCTTSAPFRGIWYSVVGDGTTLTVSTCLPGTTFDTKVQVFCDCFDYVCIGGNDDASPSDIPNCGVGGLNRKSRFSWCAALGTTYYIHVGGFNNTTTFGNVETIVTSNGVTGCTPLSCTPPVRRCCYADGATGTCQNLTAGNCALQSFGQWGTTGQTCTTACTTGRCCYLNAGVGTCAITNQAQCNAFGGTWTSGTTSCVTSPCPTGRCCTNNGMTCTDAVQQAECTFLGGAWVSAQTCAAAPCLPNETCATATAISLPYSNSIDTNFATASPIPVPSPCNTSGLTSTQNDIWLLITPASNCQLTGTIDPSNYDGVYAIWTGPDCNSLTLVQCGDDPEPYNINVALTAGTNYWVQIGDFGSTEGGGITNISLDCVVGGACCHSDGTGLITGCDDNILAANCVAAGDVYQGDGSSCASVICGGACCKLDGTCDQRVDEAACTAVSGTFYAGTDCTTTCSGGCCVGESCSVEVSEGACDALGGTFRGRGTDCTAPCPPVNDNCAGATPITDGLTPYNTTAATTDGPLLTACDFDRVVARNIWFVYTATCSGTLTIDTCEQLGGSATYDTRLAIFNTTDCNLVSDATKIGCDDDASPYACGTSGGGFHSAIEGVAVVTGNQYLITVGGFSETSAGAGVLHIACTPPGACCLPDTTCQDVANEAACTTLGGSFLGSGTLCATSNCATGACCHGDGTCTDNELEANCNGVDDVYLGNGSTCAGSQCSGRCCYTLFGFQSDCAVTNQTACEGPNFDGIWTAGETCANPCPTGRCCQGTSCTVTEEDICLDNGGTWFAGEDCSNPDADCAPPANDTCAGAIAISCGDVVNGNLIEAANDYDPAVPGPSCTGFAAVGADLVYSFSTPVSRSVTITVDPNPEFDASLYVLTTCGDTTTCIAGADDNVLAPGDETLTFAATGSTTYYVVVDKFGTSAGGPFTLTVDCPLDPCDSCEGDMDGNGRLDGRDAQIFTDCVVSSVGGIPGNPGCGCADMDGDEDVDMADVSGFAARLVDIVNKFCGDGLGRCCQDNGAICTDEVTLYECNDLGGTFTAGLDCTTECPSLPDTCDDAEALTLGVETIGDNTTGTDEVPSVVCGVSSPNQALWYTIVGTGNTMTVSTCSPSTNFDTMVQVWCGPSCAELQCVGGNDDATPFDPACELTPGAGFTRKSRVTWCSSLGQVYYIAVGGFSTTVGQFGVTVTDDGVPCAPPVSCTPPIGRCCTNGGTTCAENTQAQCTGLGGTWTVGLNCIDNPCPITATNDTCETAEPIACDDVVVSSLNGLANNYSQVDLNACTGYTSAGPDAVFSFTPVADAVVTVDMTGIAFDGSLYVVTDCNVLAPCVAGSDACCTGASEQVIFGATASTTYYIIVDAFTTAPANGDFTLTVTCDSSGGGACCSPNGICTEVAGAALCLAPNTYSEGLTCAEVVCDSCVNCTDTEGEVCGADPDIVNGGCNSAPEVFSPITCGVPVCGSAWAEGGSRDTDWYEFTLATPHLVNWAVQADFGFLVQVVDATGGCAGAVVVDGDAGAACATIASEGILNAGTHWVIVAPDDFDSYPCAAGPWSYTGTLTCTPVGAEGACCELGVCTDEPDQATCEANGGTFMGLGTTCAGTTCPAADDTCAGANPIAALPFNVAGSTVGYTDDYDAVCPFNTPGSADLTYSYTPAVNETITIDLCASAYDTKVYVLANDCTGLPIAGGCNDDACGVNCGGGAFCSQIVSVALTGGTTYFIIVDGYGGDEGAYTMSVSTP